MARKSWFTVSPVAMAAGEKVLPVEILGEIGWDVDAAEFARTIAAAGSVDRIDLSIHSPGGSVFDGWAVANILLQHPAKVTATVQGMAASMASVILLAADERRVPENGYVMIHNVSGGSWGGSEDLRQVADLLDKLQGDIVSFYATRTGQEVEALTEWMAEDTWMNGAEALARGFATEVLPAVAAAALTNGIDAIERRFANLPKAIAEAEDEAEEEEKEEKEEKEEEEEKEEAGETPTLPDPQSMIEKIKNRLLGRAVGDAVDVSLLKAELKIEVEARKLAEAEAAEAKKTLMEMQAQARELDAVLEELGLSAAEAAALPANNEEDEVLGVKDRFKAMPPGPERTAFFKAHQKELER